MALASSWPHDPFSLAMVVVVYVVHLLVCARAITRPNRTPASRAAWVAVIMFLPLVGIAAYLLLGETSIGRTRSRRLREATEGLALPDETATASLEHTRFAPLSELSRSINGLPLVGGNRIRLLGDPATPVEQPMVNSNLSIAALLADIGAARHQVHISFYIWLDDHNGGKVADAVAAAARRGVQCRVMIDALGSRAFIRSPRWRQLKDAGVHTLATLNDIPRLGNLSIGRVDLRNHRKLAIIDNAIAYCGSQNCADPEFRVAARYAPWIDILLRCEGPVVRQAQYLFLGTWIAETGEALAALPAALPGPERFEPGVAAQMFGTGPTTTGDAMSDMFVAAIYAARTDLLITTPYFVPDEALIRALCAAPRRGVATTIIFPKRNNSWLVGASCRSFYEELLDSGVQIREYTLGLLHTKSLTADGAFALVCSANMDRRSLQLNFENNLLIHDRDATAAIRQRQLSYLAASAAVDLDQVRAWPLHLRLVQDAVAMMAPVL